MSIETDQTSTESRSSTTDIQSPLVVAPPPAAESKPIQPVESRSYNRRPERDEKDSLSELLKFGVAAVVLLGVPLLISLLNPVIFGRIVPAIMGANLPTPTQSLPDAQLIQPPPQPTVTPQTFLQAYPEAGIGGEADSTVGLPSPTPLITETTTAGEASFHIVRSGETLNSIAQLYGLLPEELAAANDIQDSDQIFSGQVLTLPSAGDQ